MKLLGILAGCLFAVAVFFGLGKTRVQPRLEPAYIGTKADKPISEMKVGETGWVVPWCMYADEDGNLWLRKGYTLSDTAGGTVQMLVRKTAKGYTVDIATCDHRWSPDGSRSAGDLPVASIDGYTSTPPQAELPKDRRQKQLCDMKPGESGWTVPWGMFADNDGKLWVNVKYSVYESPGGTVSMKVERTATGYTCDVSQCRDHRWSRRTPVYVGGTNGEPVEALKGHKDSQGQASLPLSLRQRELVDLKVGESAWTTPWAMYCDEDGKLKLNGHYSAHTASGGTVQMRVTRTSTGYEVDVSRCKKDPDWDKPGKPGFVGDFKPLPVERMVN